MGDLTATQLAGMRATTTTFFSMTATRRRFADTTDVYNNTVRGAISDVTGIPCEIWQEHQREEIVDRDEQVADLLARVPIGTDITGHDQLIVAGRTYEVIGPPADKLTHIRCEIRWIEG